MSLFVSLFLAVLSLACCAGFSLAATSGEAVLGLLITVASLVAEHRLWAPRLLESSSCGPWTLDLRLNHCGACTWLHVESSPTRDRTRGSRTGRWMLYHRAIREALSLLF